MPETNTKIKEVWTYQLNEMQFFKQTSTFFRSSLNKLQTFSDWNGAKRTSLE
jgi:hypothetical protein